MSTRRSRLIVRAFFILLLLGLLVAAVWLIRHFSQPEPVWIQGQIEAQVEAAQAMADKAETGARDEQIRAARAQADAAREAYDMARDATRPEDRRAALAQVSQAEGGRAEVQVALDEAEQRASIGGEISVTVVEPGEVVGPGSPLVVISRTDDPWLTLNLREDLLAGVRMGGELTGEVPALGRQRVTFRVDYIAALADFATWRSTRDLGGFDLRTFEVRARPVQPVEGLRPGMTVLIEERVLLEGR